MPIKCMLLLCRTAAVLGCFVWGTLSYGQDCNCTADFNFMVNKVTTNYSGYSVKVTAGNHSLLDSLTTRLARESAAANEQECDSLLEEWLMFFRDGHLQVGNKRLTTVPESLSAKPPEKIRELFSAWPSVHLTERKFEEYLNDHSRKPDDIEGVWQSGAYKLGIMKKDEHAYTAFVLQGDDIFWVPGQIKAVMFKVGQGVYRCTYYMKNHQPMVLNLRKDGNELRDDRKGFSFSAVSINTSSDESADVVRLYRYDSNTMVFRMRSFLGEFRTLIDSIVTANSASLASIEHLIVDVSENQGGSDFAWKSVIPLLYTNPILVKQYETYCREEIIAKTRDQFVGKGLMSPKDEAAYAHELDLCMQHLGEFFCPGECTDTIRYEAVRAFPARISVIIGTSTASSAENFVLVAEQSTKVTLFGQPSAGVIDYGTVLWYSTPTGCREFGIPSIRSTRLPGRPIDNIGIQPEVFIPKDEQDKIGFVMQFWSKQDKLR